MTTLDSGFEDAAAEAILDDVEQKVRDDIGPAFRDRIEELLEAYQGRHEYNLDRIVDGIRLHVTRPTRRVSMEVWLPDPAHMFETGTEHTDPITGDPLSFVWERRHDPPDWVREEFEPEGDGWRVFLPEVEVADIPEGRFIRDAVNEFRRRLEA